MIKTFISRAAIFVAACLSLFMVSCVQEEYKISEEALNLELTVFQEGIALPLGSTSPFKIGAILDQYASDEIKKMFPVGEDGSYAFSMSDNFDFSSELAFLSENLAIVGINDAMDVPFDLSSVNVSDVKVEAMEVGYEQKLSEVIEPVEFKIDPITMEEPFSETADIRSYIPKDEELQIEIEGYEYSGVLTTVNDVNITEYQLNIMSTFGPNLVPGFTLDKEFPINQVLKVLNYASIDTGFNLGKTFNLENAIEMPIEFTLPNMIKSVEEIHLNDNAKIRMTLDLNDDLFFTSGDLIPHVDLPVQDLFILPGGMNDNHIIADFHLNVDNGYKSTIDFPIAGLNIDYHNDFVSGDEDGCLTFSKKISLNPEFQLSETLMTSVNKINGTKQTDISLNVNIEFIDFEIDDVAVTVEPIEVSFSQIFPLKIKQDLPEMVTGIEEVTFLNNADVLSGINLTLDVSNVDRIPGLDLGFETLELEFPEGIDVEGAEDNRLKVDIGSLSDGKTIKTVVINGITLDPTTQPEGAIEFKGDVKIDAVGRVGVKDGEAIHTKDLPKEAKDNITVKVDAVATFELDNFKVGFEGYEYVIEDTETGNPYIEQSIEFEVTKEVAELGEVKIVPETPEGNVPVIDINIQLPATKLNIGPVGEGLVIDFPDMIKFGDMNMEPMVEYSYDAVNNVLTFTDKLPSNIQIPIEYLLASAKETVKDGKTVYMVGDVFKIYGKIGVEAGIVVKEDIDALTSEDAVVSFMANVPEMVPATVSINTYQAPIEKQEFNLGESIDLSELPDQLVGVDKIELKDVYLNLDVKAAGISNILAEADVEAVLDIALPSIIMLEKNEDVAIDENNNLHVSAKLVNDEIKIAPLHVIGLDLSGVDLSDDNALKDLKISLEGNITVSNATVDMSQFENNELNIDVNYSLATKDNAKGEIEIAKVSGYIDYSIPAQYEEIDLTPLTEMLNNENMSATIDLNRFSLALELNTNLSVPIHADLNIIPYKNGEVMEDKVMSNKLDIAIPETGGTPGLVRFWISNYKQGQDPYMPEDYTHIQLDVLGLIALSPDKIAIEISAGTDPNSLCSLAPSEDGYVLKAAYAFNLPFEFGENMKLEFRQTIDDLPEELGTILKYGSFGLTGEIESSLPIELDMTYNFLDSEGNVIALTENAGHQTIKPGTVSGEAVKTDLNLIIGVSKDADVSDISSMELIFKAKSVAGAPIRKDTYIKASLHALIPEGVTVDAAQFMNKEEVEN